MQHRDKIVLQKILSEIDMGKQLLGDVTLEKFLKNEMMRRAIAMTVLNYSRL